jgi:hypothetical protein
MTRIELMRRLQHHVRTQLYDDSGATPAGRAIYGLSDPRDIADVRYVGQTGVPRRRFLQHLNTARLWLPEDRPWWVKSPRLRPLYVWIRELHQEARRLPVMVISAWAEDAAAARVVERERIMECLQSRLRLLNVETEILGRQWPLV